MMERRMTKKKKEKKTKKSGSNSRLKDCRDACALTGYFPDATCISGHPRDQVGRGTIWPPA